MEFRNLRADEIDLRVGTVSDKGVSLLLYQNARCGMDILDETVGPENWQREHYEVKGNMFCHVGINRFYNQPDKFPEWVYKSDCGVESYTEKEKGEASDSFKRAIVNWGIGRELYSAPFIWIACPPEWYEEKQSRQDRPKLTYQAQKELNKLRVSEIEYQGKQITKLVITDNDGTVAYSFPQKYGQKKPDAKKKPSNEKSLEKRKEEFKTKCKEMDINYADILRQAGWTAGKMADDEVIDKAFMILKEIEDERHS